MNMSQQQFDRFMDLSNEQLAESKNQYSQQMSLQQRALDQADAANAVSKSVADKQIAAMDQSMGYAQQDRDRYTNTFLPLQDQYIAEAKAYNTPEKQEQMAGQALAENQTQVEAQRNNLQAQLASMGVDPSQVMSTSLSTQLGVGGAAQGALAANNARNQVIQTGYDMLANAINMGNNLPAQVNASQNTGVNAGNSAAGNINQSTNNYNSASGIGQTASGIRLNSLNTASQLTGSPMSWAQLGNQSYGGASNGIMNASSIQNQMFQNQMSAQNMKNQQSQNFMNNVGTVASIAGMAMMAEGGSVDDAASLDPNEWTNFGTMPVSVQDMRMPQAAMPVSHADLSGPSSAERWGGALSALGSALGSSGSRDTFASDANMQHQWLSPKYRAEGGAMGGADGQAPRPSQIYQGALPSRQSRDGIPAMLSHDEYVIPADVVHQLGVQHFDKLVDKYHRPGA